MGMQYKTQHTTTTNSNCSDIMSDIPHAGLHSNILEQSNKEGCSNDQLIDEILKLGNHSNEVIQVDTELERNEYGFGLALSGHKNRNMMGTFICGLHPKGAA